MRRALWLIALVSGSPAVALADSVGRFPDLGGAVPSAPPSDAATHSSPSPRAEEPARPPPLREPGSPIVLPSGSQQLFDRARRLEAENRFTEALSAYTEAIRLDGSNGAALLALGRLRLRLGDPNDAELLFTTAVRLRDFAAIALIERAHLRRAVGRDAEAAQDLELAGELAPDDALGAQELATWYVARRAWLPALAVWRRLRAQPPDADVERRARVQTRALAVLASGLDPVQAGTEPGRSWARRIMAKAAR